MSESRHEGPEGEDRERRESERVEDLMNEYRERLGGLFPPEFKQHVRAARREFWLAVRSLVDARLDAIEGEPENRSRPSGRINVE